MAALKFKITDKTELFSITSVVSILSEVVDSYGDEKDKQIMSLNDISKIIKTIQEILNEKLDKTI